MIRESLAKIYIFGLICLGAGTFIAAILSSNFSVFEWHFMLFVLLSLTIASKINFQIPRVRLVLSFSDSLIFLAFLLFGPTEATLFAAIEMAFTCYVLKRNGVVFPKHSIYVNVAYNTLSISLTAIFWRYFIETFGLSTNWETAGNLITHLGILSLLQFVFTTFLVTISFSCLYKISIGEAWKKGGLSIPISQIAGAVVAGVSYKLIKNSDFLTASITAVVLIVAYFNYKKIIDDMKLSMAAAEEAQEGKAVAEMTKARDAKIHAEQLQISLVEQENISFKLQVANEALEHSVFYDALTDLPNRAHLIERLSLLIKLGVNKQNSYYILFLDLRRFKDINNRLGHDVGDQLLVFLTKRLQRIVKDEDTIARIGGDEFAIILNNLKSPTEAEKYARTICRKLANPFSVQGHKVFVRVNIGISPFDSDHKKPEDILRDADIAMHHSKEKEKDYSFFDVDLRTKVLEKIKIESHLRFAVEREELSLHYQPLISLADGEIMGFEALLRWANPKLGFISPAEFIPIAEESNLIIPITEWILKETTCQLAKWQNISPNYKNLVVSVNISGKHISQNGLVTAVRNSLEISRINPATLKLEITESTAMEDAERTVKVLAELKKVGVQLSIDDFGTGYSSLSYLHSLPFDTLKIDRSFVYKVGENGENSEVLQTIVSLAQNLRMKVIAEGIETENQLQLLRSLGCDFGQGFYMSKPLPKDQMEVLLYQKRHWFPKSAADEDFDTSSSANISNDIIYSTKVSH